MDVGTLKSLPAVRLFQSMCDFSYTELGADGDGQEVVRDTCVCV